MEIIIRFKETGEIFKVEGNKVERIYEDGGHWSYTIPLFYLLREEGNDKKRICRNL